MANRVGVPQLLKRLGSYYPFLQEKGVIVPDNGVAIISAEQASMLFFKKGIASSTLLNIARDVVFSILPKVLQEEASQGRDLSDVVNKHINFAEVILWEASKRDVKTVYQQHIAAFEEKRGEYLTCLAQAENSTAATWTECAYWHIGMADGLLSQKAEAVEQHLEQAEMWLRQADAEGFLDATDALATLLYLQRETPDEALSLWEKAAAQGHAIAVSNLTAAMVADDSLFPEEVAQSLRALWAGIAANTKMTAESAKILKAHGYFAPERAAQLSPAL